MVLILLSVSILFTGCDILKSEATIERAEKYMDRDDIDKAIEVYEELVDNDEEDYEAWFGLADAYMEDEEFEDAGDMLLDMAEVIIDNYDEEDEDLQDIIDDYDDFAEDLADEDVV
ncbi:MAG: tetratricopeptide repeat protein, partial [Vallitaleaceae bacterium]|nr:tetratricopeptide repeat protein [Vallitaleaceae bacterium]